MTDEQLKLADRIERGMAVAEGYRLVRDDARLVIATLRATTRPAPTEALIEALINELIGIQEDLPDDRPIY